MLLPYDVDDDQDQSQDQSTSPIANIIYDVDNGYSTASSAILYISTYGNIHHQRIHQRSESTRSGRQR